MISIHTNNIVGKFFVICTIAVKKPDFCSVQGLLTDTIYTELIEELINPEQIFQDLQNDYIKSRTRKLYSVIDEAKNIPNS